MERKIDYSKVDQYVDKLIEKTQEYMTFLEPQEIHDEIYKTYIYAREAHHGQMRLSGDPYITHPVEASLILLSLKPDIFTIQACILHDVIEDTPRTYDDIKDNFGAQVADLCAGMEKLSKVRYEGEDRNIGSLRKMFVAMADDLRVIFIKLADRLHNMQTLKHHPKPEKRERIANETLNIYAPIANRLGLFQLKNDLEEECFKILHPDTYTQLDTDLDELIDSRDIFIMHGEKEVSKALEGVIQNYEIETRVKSIYSIHKKMLKKGVDSPKHLHDLFGICIIVDEIADCYKALGVVHAHWKPIPQKFKDYVALPKPNGYKSLHTTIIGLLRKYRRQPTEIQIKTRKMKEFSDIGVAAHFEYKEKGSVKAQDIHWVKELKDITEDLENTDFMNSLKIDVFKDRIFVFTPQGDSINLPAGSTAVDFAYHLHSDIGNHIAIAKVNNKVYPLDKGLSNGDVIDIIVEKNKKPNPFWLSFVKTSKAKHRIRAYLNKENKNFSRDRGKDMFNKYLIKKGFPELDKDMSLLRMVNGHENSIEQRWTLLERIGNFSITPGSLFKSILRARRDILLEYNNNNKTEAQGDKKKPIEGSLKTNLKKRVIVGGEPDLPYTLCEVCCEKKIPKKLVSHINAKGIITVHSRNCSVLDNVNKERLLSAHLEGEQQDIFFSKLEFIFKNEIGIIRDLSEIIFGMQLNIEKISSKKKSAKKTIISLEIGVPDHEFLIIDRLVDRIKINLGDRLLDVKIKD